MNFKKILLMLPLFFGGYVYTAAYEDDANIVDFYVPSILANDAMEMPNFLLCFVAKTNFKDFIDKSAYRALVDEKSCEKADGADAAADSAAATGSSASSGGTAQTNEVDNVVYTPGVYENVIVGNTIEGKGWVELLMEGLKAKAYVKTVLSKDPDDNSPFGDFTMNFEVVAESRTDAKEQSIPGFPIDPVPDGTQLEKGYLKTLGKTIEYKQSGTMEPSRSLYADLSNDDAQHGYIVSVGTYVPFGGDSETYQLSHKIFLNKTAGIYCQEFVSAQKVTPVGPGVFQNVGAARNSTQFESDISGALTSPPTAYLELDGGSAQTVTGEECWSTKASDAKRIVYEYGTYTSAGDRYSGANSSAVNAMSLKSKEVNPSTNSSAYAYASYWGTHVDQRDRGFVTDSTLFVNERDNNDNDEYSLKKDYYEIWQKSTNSITLASLAGTSVQWYTQHYKDDTSGSTNWANQLNALNVPITGACNATDGNCPEYTGKITSSGGTVTFTLTEGMDWRQNPPVHVTLTTPIVFTAANWVTNMTDGSGWNRGMHFWDPDANQGYNIRYTSFQNPTSDSNANAVKQRTRTKIAATDLPTNLTCLERCLSEPLMNTALAAAFTAFDTNNPQAGALNVTPYYSVGPYLKVDAYYDASGSTSQDSYDDDGTGDFRMYAGDWHWIGGTRETRVYTVDSASGVITDSTASQALDWTTANQQKIDSGSYENKLDKYEYWEKDNTMGAGQNVGLTYNVLRSNHSQRFGWAYHMELIDSTDLSNLACETEGLDARGYTARIKSFASQNTSLLQAATTYYCLDKLYRGEVDSYEINVVQRPRYKVYNETRSQFANIMAPETFEVEINDTKATYNFTGTDKTDYTGRKVKLKFEGFGALHNFPGKVYNHCENTILGRYHNGGWNDCLRYVHEFSLANGTTLTNISNPGNDIKIRQLRGDEYLKILTNSERNALAARTYTSTAADLAADSVLIDLANPSASNFIGAQPTTILNDGKPSVIHGETIVAP